MSSARYTRTVGSWRVRSVCVAVLGALAGAPAVWMLCAVRCAAPLPTTAESTSPAVHHHDAAVAQGAAPAAAPAVHHAADSDDQPPVSTTGIALPESHARLTAWGEQECCTSPGQALQGVTAARADTGILFMSQKARMPHVAVFDPSNRLLPAPRDAPPRSRSAPACTTLVLRI
jgi:hypothetical protein